ncbi:MULTISPECIES: TIGR04255 family protein [Streptomycetaceae]|uniref:TIGR04255 family protein n=1 Tax=Streptomycetaceae TaxID=2062 RepID=UPI00059F1E50|nr:MULTISPECIES: TIGR04255 family protein [Streptomycetaceae]
MVERGPLFERVVVDDVPLPDAPLVRVIGQLRFGTLSVLASGNDAAQAFMKELSGDYPFVEQGFEQTMLFTPGQPMKQAEAGSIWRLRSADQSSVVALTNGALTLETTAYQGRTEFCRELTRLGSLLESVTRLPSFSRIAVRYTNRLVGETTLSSLSSLVHPELVGLVGAPLGGGAQLTFALSQALLALNDGKLLVQFGRLPENGTIDPTLPAVAEPSWLLDLDSYGEFPDPRSALPAEAEQISRAAVACAERAHTFFRWAVTEEFLTHFGGRP